MGHGIVGLDAFAVDVDVLVGVAAVGVIVRVDLEGLPQRPQADANQQRADEAVAETGDEFNGQNAAQEKQQDADGSDAGGVAGSPTQTDQPRPVAVFQCEWRNGGQMVRAGEDVDEAGDDSA